MSENSSISVATHYKVSSIWQKDDRHLCIEWTDQITQEFDVVMLRKMCPCASCVDETTGKRTVDPDTISDSIRPKQIQSTGLYAMSIAFDDHHNTGIYTFDYLRSLGSQH